MDTSPLKRTTTRVIDALQQEIDVLKSTLRGVQVSSDECMKRCQVLAMRNELVVDQLANQKHENEVVSALLARKERRLKDVEAEYHELVLQHELLQQKFKSVDIRCQHLEQLTHTATAEHERLKIAYEALLQGQAEYKLHYQREVTSLCENLGRLKQETAAKLVELLELVESRLRDVEVLLEALAAKRSTISAAYVKQNRAEVEMLMLLARAARASGEETLAVLEEVAATLEALKELNPDLALRIDQLKAGGERRRRRRRPADDKEPLPRQRSHVRSLSTGLRPARPRDRRRPFHGGSSAYNAQHDGKARVVTADI